MKTRTILEAIDARSDIPGSPDEEDGHYAVTSYTTYCNSRTDGSCTNLPVDRRCATATPAINCKLLDLLISLWVIED